MPSSDFEFLTVTKRELLAPQILSLHLQRADRSILPPFTAGAHIYVQINDQFQRAYSLCGNPANRRRYEIAVKLEPEGRGGSKALYQIAQQGVQLKVSPPCNVFELSEDAPHHLLVGGGVGLTPLIAMAYQLSAERRPFTLLVAAPSVVELPFKELLMHSSWPVEICRNPRQALDVAAYLNKLPTGTHVYCCGPEGLIKRVSAQCCHLPKNCWHEERFSANEKQVFKGFELYLSESDRTLQVEAGNSMLVTLKQSGIYVESACEQGICGSCVVPWSDGEPVHRDQCLDEDDRREYIALCCGSCRSERLTLEL
ncbi:PDR/VanB family oxidoreductase [Halomonas sp. NPDC076908]|uniref:PDR/VanB family oxidoreductase n=1 Tax=Halomonas sp. NPDC076908 TaxID=3390567 RepID=UPI003D07BAEA